MSFKSTQIKKQVCSKYDNKIITGIAFLYYILKLNFQILYRKCLDIKNACIIDTSVPLFNKYVILKK